MEKQLTASEVRAEAHRHANEVEDMLNAFADMLEAREKAVPVYQHRSKNGSMLRWFDCSEETFMAMEYNEHDKEHFDRRILYTHPAPADAEKHDTITPRELAKRIERGEKWKLADPCQSQDAERWAEALRDARDTVLAFLGDVAADGSRCGMKQAVIKSMFASLLDRFAAHSAQAQPPAASVTDGFVFERVNMGRGNERYVGLADGSEGTTVQEDGDGPGDTRSRLLWRIADAALAAQENPNG